MIFDQNDSCLSRYRRRRLKKFRLKSNIFDNSFVFYQQLAGAYLDIGGYPEQVLNPSEEYTWTDTKRFADSVTPFDLLPKRPSRLADPEPDRLSGLA